MNKLAVYFKEFIISIVTVTVFISLILFLMALLLGYVRVGKFYVNEIEISNLDRKHLEKRISRYVEVDQVERKWWRGSSGGKCWYTKLTWLGQGDFSLNEMHGAGEKPEIILKPNASWSLFKGRWYKGPVQTRKPSARVGLGNVKKCFAPRLGGMSNPLKSILKEDVWFFDLTSQITLVNNTTKTIVEVTYDP